MKPGMVFAWIGGAQPSMLRDSPADASKFSAMGAVLIGTAGMAALSSAFALNTAVGLPLAAAAVVGVLWGLLILSLDRMLVISMARQSGFWRGVGAALPRLGLALLIGTVISVPLVLKIFEPELNNELQVMHSENLIANQKKLDEQFADIAPTQTKVDALQKAANGQATLDVNSDPDVKAAQTEAAAAQTAYTKAAENAQCELNGECGSKVKGDGPAYRAAKAEADRARERLDRANAKLQQVTDAANSRIGGGAEAARKAAAEELKTLAPALEARKAARLKAQQKLDEGEAGNEGLLARLEALERLSKGHPSMWTAHLALMALFACIELLPVLAKLLSGSKRSMYDQLVTKREDRALLAEQRWQNQQDQLDDMRFDVRRQLEADRLDGQLESGKRANALLVEKQEEIAHRAIDVWGKVAAQRTDAELARWYRHYSQHAPAGPNGPAGSAPPGVPAQFGPVNVQSPVHRPSNGQAPAIPQPPTTPVVGP